MSFLGMILSAVCRLPLLFCFIAKGIHGLGDGSMGCLVVRSGLDDRFLPILPQFSSI